MMVAMESAACERMVNQAAVKPSNTGALLVKVISAVKVILAGKPVVNPV
jgi:hypothetical protein